MLGLAKRNRYNLLCRTERLMKLKQWWALIPTILPCRYWRAAWSSAVQQVGAVPIDEQSHRSVVQQWMWRIEEQVWCWENTGTAPPWEALDPWSPITVNDDTTVWLFAALVGSLKSGRFGPTACPHRPPSPVCESPNDTSHVTQFV